MNDFKNIDDLLKQTSGEYMDKFIDYILEYTRHDFECLDSCHRERIKHFNRFSILYKHIFVLIILEGIKQGNNVMIGDYIEQFKEKYQTDISQEKADLEKFVSYLIEKANLRIYTEKEDFAKIVKNVNHQSNLWNEYREKLFPERPINPDHFIEIYKEAIFIMIYLTYKAGKRNNLALFDDKENHILSEWIMKNRHYGYLANFANPDVLSYRMSEILRGEKRGLFD